MRFDSYHPAINFIYFATAIACTLAFNQPVFLAISFLCAFAYSVKLRGRKALPLNLALLPLMAAYTWWYSYYNHFGVTNLRTNFAGNWITLESVAAGAAISVAAAAVIMWMSCVFTVVSSDKVVYLLGRISPKLSLFFSILLRMFPRCGRQLSRINTARRGIGRGAGQGSFPAKALNSVKILSALISWTLEEFVESSVSMRNRGYSLKGRTAFSIYRFDNRDRSLVVVMFICITLIIMAVMLDQTAMMFDPEIIINRITPVSIVFYGAYALLLVMPGALQIADEMRFRRNRKNILTNCK